MALRIPSFLPAAFLISQTLLFGSPALAEEKEKPPTADVIQTTEGEAPAEVVLVPITDPKVLLTNIQSGQYKNLSEETLRKNLKGMDAGVVIGAGLLLLEAQPEYTVRLIKQETLHGDIQEADTIDVSFRRAPLGIYSSYSGGPYAGREILYDHSTLPGKITVIESGILGFMAFHIDVDSGLTKRSTNHTIYELGLEYPLSLMKKDLSLLTKEGKSPDLAEGKLIELNGRTLWELTVSMTGPPTYYAHKVRLGFDLSSGLVMLMEVQDKQGKVLEYFEYQNLIFAKHPAGTFDEDNPAYGF